MEQKLNVEFLKLVTDQRFIDWVKNPDPESDSYWKKYLLEHPSSSDEINQARYIIQRLQPEEKEVNKEEIHSIWMNILNEKSRPVRKLNITGTWWIAASVALLIGLGSLFLYQMYVNDSSVEYESFTGIQAEGNEVKLILSDNTEKLIETKDPAIEYNPDGGVLVNSLSLTTETDNKDESGEVLNQLVVPKGKRSSLTLSDGTRVFLNSGSRVIYPVVFKKKKREIFVEGEMYLEVSGNPDWPFVVVTDHMKVKVLGTEFNVKSYPDETKSCVVLVKGSIQAIVSSKKIPMQVNDKLTLSNQTGEISVGKVNVLEHISWKDGWMYCNNERMESIATKLSRYYDIKITFKDPAVKELMVIGKLDLKSDYHQVLDVIGFIASIGYTEMNGNIQLSLK